MRADRRHPLLRAAALAIPAVLSLGALAQDVPAASTPPLIPTSPTTNYVMLGLAVAQMIIVLAMASVLRTMMGSSGWMRKLTGRRGQAPLVALFLLLPAATMAQAYVPPRTDLNDQQLFYVLLGVNILLFIIILAQVNLLRGTLRALTGPLDDQRAATKPQAPSAYSRLMAALTRRPSRDVEERELVLHHEYDGIRELDNVLPPWWVWLFYGSIAWSVIYLVNMHVTRTWPDSIEEYTAQVEQAKADVAAYVATAAAAVDENTVTITTDAGALAGAKATFTQYCAACHGPDAAGSETSVGPNLTDGHWLHGGGVKNVFKTIKYGVPEKGMISWKSQLSPVEIQALASYIVSLQGTGGPTQKAPQGEAWTEEAAPLDSTAAPTDTAAAPMDTATIRVAQAAALP